MTAQGEQNQDVASSAHNVEEPQDKQNLDLPTCGKCGEVMTPETASIHPEYFLHDRCLPPECLGEQGAERTKEAESPQTALLQTALDALEHCRQRPHEHNPLPDWQGPTHCEVIDRAMAAIQRHLSENRPKSDSVSGFPQTDSEIVAKKATDQIERLTGQTSPYIYDTILAAISQCIEVAPSGRNARHLRSLARPLYSKRCAMADAVGRWCSKKHVDPTKAFNVVTALCVLGYFDTEKCEGCGAIAVKYDTEGVPLCAVCAELP